MRRYFFLLLLPWVASMTLQAFPSLVLKDEMIYATVRGQYLGIYEDERQLGIQDVMRFPSDSFYVVYKIPTNKNKKAVYWLCFKLDNQDAKDKKWLLEFFDHHINEVALYTTKSDGSIEKIRSGDRMAFSQRKFWHKNIVFDLNLPYRQSKTYYIRIKSENENVIMPELRSYERFISYALSEYYLLGLFYGILLVMALYNFLLFLAIRRVTYLYYVLYVLSMIFQTMCLNGLGFQFVWPKHPWINGIGMDLSVFMTMLFSVMFTKDFLHFERHFPKVTRMLNLMLMLRAISVIVGVVFFPTWGASWRWLDLIPFTITCVAAITCFVREDSTSRYFVIAFTLVYVMLTINILEMYGLIWSDIFTVYSLNIGIVLEIIFLSISLADQLRREIRQKEVAQAQLIEQMKQSELISQRVNRELEAKVRQRTIELNEANEKLKTQVKDTTLMNLQLDTQNWNLRKDVTEIAQKRILRPVVDLKEFSKAYSDELSCYRYIAQLKTEKKVLCRKCNSDSFGKGKDTFDKRCTKCGYNESVTANTLFHKLKFPIDKAFYMTHLVFTRNDITTEELSELVSLRKETCYQFKKKVLDRMHELDPKVLDSWDVLILND